MFRTVCVSHSMPARQHRNWLQNIKQGWKSAQGRIIYAQTLYTTTPSRAKNTRQNETRKKGVSLHKRWLFTIWCLTQEQRGLFSIHTQTLYTETCIVRLEIIDHGEPVVALVTKKIRRQKRRRHKERDWSQTMKEGGKCVQEKCLYSNAWQCLCQVDT